MFAGRLETITSDSTCIDTNLQFNCIKKGVATFLRSSNKFLTGSKQISKKELLNQLLNDQHG